MVYSVQATIYYVLDNQFRTRTAIYVRANVTFECRVRETKKANVQFSDSSSPFTVYPTWIQSKV